MQGERVAPARITCATGVALLTMSRRPPDQADGRQARVLGVVVSLFRYLLDCDRTVVQTSAWVVLELQRNGKRGTVAYHHRCRLCVTCAMHVPRARVATVYKSHRD